MQRAPEHSRHPHRQQGATLIVALIILLAMTVIGVTAMQTATIQERMAGNARDMDLAFQAAEAALRDAEEFLESPSIPAFDGTNGLYQAPELGSEAIWENDTFNWVTNARQYSDSSVQFGTAERPAYVIEQMAISWDVTGGVEADVANEDAGVYRVTARGVGGNASSVAIVQSVFVR